MQFIWILIKKWYISKAGWRIIETALVCGFTYLLWAIISWDALNLQALIIATITPVYLWVSKAQRDLISKSK